MHELDRRSTDGLDVRLMWREGSSDVIVEVADEMTGEAFALIVPGGDALDAFRHPYAYRCPERASRRATELV